MELGFLLVAFIPVVSLLAGLGLLIAGLMLRKSNNQRAKVCFLAGGLCIGICAFVYMAFFLVGALGIGPVPN